MQVSGITGGFIGHSMVRTGTLKLMTWLPSRPTSLRDNDIATIWPSGSIRQCSPNFPRHRSSTYVEELVAATCSRNGHAMAPAVRISSTCRHNRCQSRSSNPIQYARDSFAMGALLTPRTQRERKPAAPRYSQQTRNPRYDDVWRRDNDRSNGTMIEGT